MKSKTKTINDVHCKVQVTEEAGHRILELVLLGGGKWLGEERTPSIAESPFLYIESGLITNGNEIPTFNASALPLRLPCDLMEELTEIAEARGVLERTEKEASMIRDLRFKTAVTKEQDRQIQELVFRCGGTWRDGSSALDVNEHEFLFLGETDSGVLSYTDHPEFYGECNAPLRLPTALIKELTEMAERIEATQAKEAGEFDMSNCGRIDHGDLSKGVQARFNAIHRSRLDRELVGEQRWVACAYDHTKFGCRDYVAYRLRPDVEESGEPLERDSVSDTTLELSSLATFDMRNPNRLDHGKMSEELQERFTRIHRSRLDRTQGEQEWVRCTYDPQAFGCRDSVAYRLRPGVKESSRPLRQADHHRRAAAEELASFNMGNTKQIKHGDLSAALQDRFNRIHDSRLDHFVNDGRKWTPREIRLGNRCCYPTITYRLRPGVEESSEPLETEEALPPPQALPTTPKEIMAWGRSEESVDWLVKTEHQNPFLPTALDYHDIHDPSLRCALIETLNDDLTGGKWLSFGMEVEG